MSEKPNILFIVEGERLEPEVINRMAEVYGLRCDISSVCTNIHILYQQLKQDDGYSDVIPVLQEILRSRLASLETLTPSAELKRKIARTRDDLAKLNHTFASFISCSTVNCTTVPTTVLHLWMSSKIMSPN